MVAERSDDPALMTAADLLAAFADGSLSPVEATEAALARIERHDPVLNAYLLVDRDRALDQARASEARWRAGEPCGLLDGVTVSIKDILLSEGWPTLRGSRTVNPAQTWAADAPITARLREHGAVMLGKTTTPEFGWKGVTDSPLTGITRNPWNPERTPGGSSGGAAAAVATGMGTLATGTDAGGSIRIPCGFTGIFGLKPSFGRVPAWPVSPFGTLAHLGPMTRTVADAALMMNVIAQPDHRDVYALPYDRTDYVADLAGGIVGMRIAFSPSLGGHEVDPEIALLVRQAVALFEELGATVEEAEPELGDTKTVFNTHWHAGAALLAQDFGEEQFALMDPGLVEVVARGNAISLLDHLNAVRRREAMTLAMAEFHRSYDLLLTPMLPIPAFSAGRNTPEGDPDSIDWPSWTPFTFPFNLTGQPAASVPCGLTPEGMPAGLHIVGPRHADAVVLRAAATFEEAKPFKMPVAPHPAEPIRPSE